MPEDPKSTDKIVQQALAASKERTYHIDLEDLEALDKRPNILNWQAIDKISNELLEGKFDDLEKNSENVVDFESY